MDLDEPGVTTTARKSAPVQPEMAAEEIGELEEEEETLAHISEGSRMKKRELGKKNPFMFFNKETRPILWKKIRH